jgi:outer membrane receptor protein involved in Fe transport
MLNRAFLLLLIVCTNLTAQNAGKISGTVHDRASGEPLPGVTITVKGTALGASTSADGTYFVLNVPPGEYDVVASMIGYQSVVQQGVIVNLNRTTSLAFHLTETTVDLPEVMIVAKRPDVELDKTSSSAIVRPEEIQSLPAMQNLSDVLTLTTDVVDGHFRGGREGEESYNVSGMGIVNPLNSSSAFTPMVSAMEEVEVITSGFGAQYGNAQSGVVNITMKEGSADRWKSRAEARTRMPGRKHFGPSIFDPNSNPYLTLLDSYDKWLGTDTALGQRYYSSIGNGFDNRYGQDTITLAQIAYTLWSLQGRRDLNRNYGYEQDYSFDVTMGGPISSRARLFLAGRIDNEWLSLPTEDPEIKRQFMGNLAYDLGSGMSLKVLGTYSQEYGYVFRSQRTNGLLNWLWDRILGLNYSKEDNLQLGARFSHAISPSTYYELKLSGLLTRYKDGSPVTDPDGYIGDPNKIIWGAYEKTPDNFNVGNADDNFRDEKTRTISFDGSLTSQVTNEHQVLTGVQANLFSIDVRNRIGVLSSSGERTEFYSADPYEFGFYLQDKMEFEGMIANVGVRWDLWNQNTDYYTDLYSPWRSYVNDTDYVRDPALAKTAPTPTIGRLQPRIGISFPITISTVFHLNYGSFVQRPSFERTISSQLPKIGYARMQFGNPRLNPQETNSYDVGVTQGIGEGFTFDVSGYYKDVKNLIQRAYYVDSKQALYSTFVNRDYADIRGFRIAVTKREGFITGSLNYTYGVATGKSSTPFNASPTFSESGRDSFPSPKDPLLDFDRTHNLIANVSLSSDSRWGPELFGVHPFELLTVGINSFARSGRPYTYNRRGENLLMNKRAPAEYNTKIKISRKFPKVIGSSMTVYLEVNNVFDSRIYSYNAVFLDATAASGSSYINRNLSKYEENPAALTIFDDDRPFIANQEFLLYDNSPRSFFLGVTVNF